MKLKVCGMKYQDNMNQVATLQPDYLGFIFYEKSQRYFTGSIPELPPTIKKTGVFVDETLVGIVEKAREYELDAIQLHGNESPEFCEALKRHYEESRIGPGPNPIDEVISSIEADCHALQGRSRNDDLIEIIKVFSIKDEFDFDRLKPYEAVCDYYLFDTKGKLPGGNSYTFDWTVLHNYSSTKPFFLSGGIGPEQVGNLKAFAEMPVSAYCYALDVNSRFEVEPGLKDAKKLKQFKNKLTFEK
jgi:phosphoribosylanthranilate isomerase